MGREVKAGFSRMGRIFVGKEVDADGKGLRVVDYRRR